MKDETARLAFHVPPLARLGGHCFLGTLLHKLFHKDFNEANNIKNPFIGGNGKEISFDSNVHTEEKVQRYTI